MSDSLEDRRKDQPILFDGVYFGIVEDNVDPERLGRVRVRVNHVHSPDPAAVPTDRLPWADLIQIGGGNPNQGLYAPPTIGSQVAVMFIQGYAARPICLGTVYGRNEAPDEVKGRAASTPSNNTIGTNAFPGTNTSSGVDTAVNVRELKSPGGHKIVFDDNADSNAVIIESAKGGVISIVDAQDNARIELQTDGGNNITLWDGNATTPARIEITTPGGHTMIINDDPANQMIAMTTKLGHTFQMIDAGQGEYISLRTKNGCQLKLDDLGSAGAARVALNTQHGVQLNMLDDTDTMQASTRGGTGFLLKDNSQAAFGTATGFRIDFGSASQKLTMQCPASGTMDILCGGAALTIHSDGDLLMSANGTVTIQGAIVKIN